MKASIIIPTVQYGNVTYEFEGEPEEALIFSAKMNELAKNPRQGVPRKDFNKFLDDQLHGKGGDVNVFEAMSERQQLVIQEVKKAMARAETKL